MTAANGDSVQAISKGQIRRRGKLTIRAYQPGDEEAVRDICYATGFLGRPVSDWIDVNRELFTDLWLTYYLEVEPESAFVAEREGQVIGYLTGCLDSRKHKRFQDTRLPWILLCRLLRGRYRFGRRAIALAFRGLFDAVRYGFPRIPWQDYPAHLHYNVRDGNRGTVERCGIHLLDAFCGHMAQHGVMRCHGLMVAPQGDVERRYRSLGEVHDRRRTTLYRPADPRDLEMICRVFDLRDISTRYAKYVAMTLPDTPPAAAGPQHPGSVAGLRHLHCGPAGRIMQAGLLLAALATALVLPGLPLRLSAPALLLLVPALALRRPTHTVRFVMLAYTWFWMANCVLASRGSDWYPIALLGLAAGFLLSLPASAAAFRSKSSVSPATVGGIAAGLLIFILAAVGLTLAGPATITLDLQQLILLSAAAMLSCLAALAGLAVLPMRMVRRSQLFTLGLGVAAVLLVTGAWQVSARRANHALARGRYDEAMGLAQREAGWAESLGLQWAQSHALHRQAEIHKAAKQITQWFALQSRAAALAPRDMAMRVELLRHALATPGLEHDAIAWFTQLPDARISGEDANILVDIALETQAWSALSRSLRLADNRLPRHLNPGSVAGPRHLRDPVDWAAAGKSMAALDNWPAAAALLQRAIEETSPSWETIRILCVALLETGNSAAIRPLLNEHTTPAHADEAAWLLALAAQAGGTLTDEQATLLARPGPGVKVGQRLVLTSCKLEASRLQLSWQAIGPVPASWRVFVHIREARYGGSFFQADHRFDDVGRDPDSWPIGSALTYSIPITIPESAPPGTYRVIVGVWDGQENQPLQADPSTPIEVITHNRILAGSLKVD